MIPLLYQQTYEKVQGYMMNSFAVCLTTDGWTSIKNESYLGVTGHFINENSLLQSVCHGCENFNERHTIENLSVFLKNIVCTWGIQHKIVAVVSDNAPNIVGAIKDSNFRHISCFAHNVNLVVQKGLKKIINVQKKVKSIVEHFKISSHAQSKLQDIQKQLGLSPLKLKQDVITRWNSTHDMFKRILEIKDAVVSTLAILQCTYTDHTDHIHNFMGLVRLEQNKSTIADALSEGARLNKTIYNENVRKNRVILLQLIEVTLLLGKQELAFRDHDERSTSSNQGNFREVFNLLIKRNDELLSHYNKISNVFTGQSKTIQNEIIYCVYEYVLDVIKSEINDAFFFSIISDDTTDIVEKSQCAITICNILMYS